MSRVLFASPEDQKLLCGVDAPFVKAWPSVSLRIVAFSDYRVQDIALLVEFVRNLRPAPHLIAYGGDDVERFQDGGRNFFEELAATAMLGLCAVVGNDPVEKNADQPAQGAETTRIRILDEVNAARAYISGKDVHNVHTTPVVIGKYAVIGMEGSPPDEEYGALGTVIYSEKNIARHLRVAADAVNRKHLVVVSHTPPRGVLDLAQRFGGRNIGSVSLRQFLLKQGRTPLVICGHVHREGAKSAKLGRTTVVNAASHDNFGAPGRVAVIDLRAGKVVAVQWHVLWELCCVSGIGPGREARLRAAGVHRIEQLAEASGQSIAKAIKGGLNEGVALCARATSLLKQEMVVGRELQLPPQEGRAYVDVETDRLGQFIWLVGIHVEGEGKSYAFYAETPEEEKQILTNMLAFLAERPDLSLLSYSGCLFEERLLGQRLAAHGLAAELAENIKDIYFAIHDCVGFPTPNLTLKAIAAWCGYKWRTSLNGFAAALTYGKGNVSKTTKRKLITYNEDDLLAVKHVVQQIEKCQGRALAAAR